MVVESLHLVLLHLVEPLKEKLKQKGFLDGLRIAEIEFSTDVESDNFRCPEWFGEEVTEDERYKNWSLALNGIPSEDRS